MRLLICMSFVPASGFRCIIIIRQIPHTYVTTITLALLFPLIGEAEIAVNTTVGAKNAQTQLSSYIFSYSCFGVPSN